MAMTQGDISNALASMSKEDLLRNCVTQIQQMQEQLAKAQADIADRDRTISRLQSQSQVSQDVSNRLIQSAQSEAQKIVDEANQSKESIQRQSETIVQNAREQSKRITDDAQRQGDQVIADARDQASALIAAQLKQAQGELDKVNETKQKVMESTLTMLQGIMGECDRVLPTLSQGTADIQALQRVLQDSISDVQKEQFQTYPSYQPQSPIVSSIIQPVAQPVSQPRRPVVTRGIDVPQKDRRNRPEPSSDDSDDIVIPQPQRKQMPETFTVDDDEDDFTFNPDTADSFTSEFMGITDDQLDEADKKPEPKRRDRKSKGGWY